MHHILKFYSKHQELVLRFYMFCAKLTKLPVIGKLIMIFGNWYAVAEHGACVLTPEEAKKAVDAATSIAVGDCMCRKVFNNCSNPVRTDIVIGMGYDIFTEIRRDEYDEISKEEAGQIIDECSKRGLMQSLVKCRGEVFAICNCCPCCCVPFRVGRVYGIKKVWLRDKSILEELTDMNHGIPEHGTSTKW